MTIQELSDEMRRERARCSTHCGTDNIISTKGDIGMNLALELSEIEKQVSVLISENIEYKKQLTKAKVALRNVIDYLGQFCSDYPDCVIEAEEIFKEIEK